MKVEQNSETPWRLDITPETNSEDDFIKNHDVIEILEKNLGKLCNLQITPKNLSRAKTVLEKAVRDYENKHGKYVDFIDEYYGLPKLNK